MNALPERPDFPASSNKKVSKWVKGAGVVALSILALGAVGAVVTETQPVAVHATPAPEGYDPSLAPNISPAPEPEPEPVEIACTNRYAVLQGMKAHIRATGDIERASRIADVTGVIRGLKDAARSLDVVVDEVDQTDPLLAGDFRTIAELELESARGWASGDYGHALSTYQKATRLINTMSDSIGNQANNTELLWCDEI